MVRGKIKELMKKKGMNQTLVAKAIGLNKTTLNLYLNRVPINSIGELKKMPERCYHALCEVLDIDLDSFKKGKILENEIKKENK